MQSDDAPRREIRRQSFGTDGQAHRPARQASLLHKHAWHRDAGRAAMAVEFLLSVRFDSISSVMAELDSAYLFSTDPLRARRAKAIGGHELRTTDVRLAISTVEPRLGELADDRSIAKASALISQVRNGHYHIVIYLQPFIAHRLTDQLFDLDMPGTKAVQAQGYGMVQIKRALERYFPRPK